MVGFPLGLNFGAQSYMNPGITSTLAGLPTGLPDFGLGSSLTMPTGVDVLGQLGKPGGGLGGIFSSGGMDAARLGLAGIGTIGSLWGAFQAANLAKKQFNFTRDVTETNMANQLKTYNTSLTDRANNRAIVEGRDAAYTQNYIDTNKLSRFGR